MTTTIMELIANLKIYADQTAVTIKDVDDVEFAIVDFKSFDGGLTIVIGEKEYEEGDEEEEPG